MVFESVKKIINEQLGIDENEITMDSDFLEDLGADSLEIIDLIMAFESEFSMEIPEEDVEGIRTVSDAVSYIQNHANLD